MKSLNEVIDIVGLKRRAIQEYEKAGVADTPTTTNKYGHLLYDEDHIRHLWLLRFYKELGYKTPDIKQILADPDFDIHKALSEHIIALEKKKEDLEHLISVAKALNELELSPNAISRNIAWLNDLSYDDSISILATVFNNLFPMEGTSELSDGLITDEDWEKIFDAVDRIMEDFRRQLKYDSHSVQSQVHIMHSILSKSLSDSVLVFSGSIACFSPGTEGAKDIEEEYGTGSSDFLYSALRKYCSANADNPTDNKLLDALDTIANLGSKKYTTYSEEVQSQVASIHKLLMEIPILTSEEQFKILQYFIEIYNSNSMKKLIDDGNERGISWFISRSIEIYCQNHRMDAEGGKNE